MSEKILDSLDEKKTYRGLDILCQCLKERGLPASRNWIYLKFKSGKIKAGKIHSSGAPQSVRHIFKKADIVRIVEQVANEY